MLKKVQLTAIVLAIQLTALAVAAVQFYRIGRDQNNLLYSQGLNQADFTNSLRNASDALQSIQIHAADYVVTGGADSLRAYRESRLDWEYESGTLNLLPGADSSAALVHEFLETGNQLADETGAIVSLFVAGAHDKALDHLRTGAVAASREKFNWMSSRIKLKTKVADQKVFDSSYKVFKALRGLIYCAGGFCLLGLSGIILLIYFGRTSARGKVEARSAG